jgi:predicted lipid-binding transport protein (Tim44 family)
MDMSSNLFIIALVFALLLAGVLAFLFIKQRRQFRGAEKKAAADTGKAASADIGGVPSRQMQLQAYERLILLTDRIALPNLIQRANQPGLSAREMQSLLTLSIRQEFEHNITQQIYVSAEAWDAVRNYKEQNLLIVNQVGSYLPEGATGNDLNRQLLDLLVQNPKASLQNVVAEALSFEAKKLL